MKLNQLRDFVAIVEHGSLRAAARHLDVAQPLLTRSVQALEKELGVPLFEREARGMTLTPMGRLFHQRASAVVNEIRRAHDDIAQSAGDGSGTVAAALSIMPHVGMLPYALPAFRRRYPKVRLQIIEGLFPDVEGALRNGEIDFYLGASPRGLLAPGLVTRTLFQNTRAVVGRKGHPFMRARSLHELAAAEWATTSVDYNSEEDLERLFERHGLPAPRVMLKVRSAMSLMVALTHTDLLALLPVQWGEFALTREVLQVIPVTEVLAAPEIVMIRRPDLPLTPAAEFFSDLLQRRMP